MQYVFLIRSRSRRLVTYFLYHRRSSVSKTRIAWARNRFYIFILLFSRLVCDYWPRPGPQSWSSRGLALRTTHANLHRNLRSFCFQQVVFTRDERTKDKGYTFWGTQCVLPPPASLAWRRHKGKEPWNHYCLIYRHYRRLYATMLLCLFIFLSFVCRLFVESVCFLMYLGQKRCFLEKT